MAALPAVTIVTLAWNGRDHTHAFLTSCRQLTYPHYRTILVDNGSVDGTAVMVASDFPEVTILHNDHNAGFAQGVNHGIQLALAQGAEYIFLANNDTCLARDVLERTVEVARQMDAGLVSPVIFYADKPHCIWSAGARRRRYTLEITDGYQGQTFTAVPATPFAVDFVTACGVLLARPCVTDVGLFDERFFMYYEDLDYCWRAKAAGWPILVAPAAHMWHRVAASSGGRDSALERYHMARSSALYFRKYARGWHWLIIFPYRLASAGKTVGRLVYHGRHASACAYCQGILDGWRL